MGLTIGRKISPHAARARTSAARLPATTIRPSRNLARPRFTMSSVMKKIHCKWPGEPRARSGLAEGRSKKPILRGFLFSRPPWLGFRARSSNHRPCALGLLDFPDPLRRLLGLHLLQALLERCHQIHNRRRARLLHWRHFLPFQLGANQGLEV